MLFFLKNEQLFFMHKIQNAQNKEGEPLGKKEIYKERKEILYTLKLHR